MVVGLVAEMVAFGQDPGSKIEERYARYFVPGCVLLTVETFGREPHLADDAVAHTLQMALGATERATGCRNVAYVILPEHLHLLTRPHVGTNTDALVHRLTNRFERDYRAVLGLPTSARTLDNRYQMHSAHRLDEFAFYLDAIHYDPVHHGLAKRPEEWLCSSYERWIERGVYTLGWGWTTPESCYGRGLDH